MTLCACAVYRAEALRLCFVMTHSVTFSVGTLCLRNWWPPVRPSAHSDVPAVSIPMAAASRSPRECKFWNLHLCVHIRWNRKVQCVFDDAFEHRPHFLFVYQRCVTKLGCGMRCLWKRVASQQGWQTVGAVNCICERLSSNLGRMNRCFDCITTLFASVYRNAYRSRRIISNWRPVTICDDANSTYYPTVIRLMTCISEARLECRPWHRPYRHRVEFLNMYRVLW